ncbi:MAG: hypothetical protein COA66_10285 [Arcobacter sp.]|nr:MAG: hypothetical protein COA66_10285 [Arcobacter sp.]
MENNYSIKEFIKLDDLTQKNYVINFEKEEQRVFLIDLKKKDMRLSLQLSSFIQSSKNMDNTESVNKIITILETNISVLIDIIKPNPNQPRKIITEPEITEKVKSIENRGLITPITVYKDEKGEYILISGQLRLKAYFRLHEKEKLDGVVEKDYKYQKIPVYIKEAVKYSKSDFEYDGLIENIIRTELHVVDAAISIKNVFENQDKSLNEFSQLLGKSSFYVSSYIKIAEAGESFLSFIREKDIQAPTIIYLIIRLDKTLDEKKALIEQYIAGDIKKSDLIKIKSIDSSTKENKANVQEKVSLFDNVFSFKKIFTKKKYNSLDKKDKLVVDNKLNEIVELQKEINRII